MTFRQALRRLTHPSRGRQARRPKTSRRRFELECLPDRTLLSATLVGGTLEVTGDSPTANTITVDRDPANSGTLDVWVNGVQQYSKPYTTVTGGITISRSSFYSTPSDTVNLETTFPGVPVSVWMSYGHETVNVSPLAKSLDHIKGDVFVSGQMGLAGSSAGTFGSLEVHDENAPNNTYTMSVTSALSSGASVTRSGSAKIGYSSMNLVSVFGGAGASTFNVLGTPDAHDYNYSPPISGTTRFIGSGPATVNVGAAGSVSGIRGALNIVNPPNFNTITVDDSADTTNRTVTLGFGTITGLAPAAISYAYGDTASMAVKTGRGGATVNVLSTGVPTNLIGNGPDTVNVGNNGSVSGIRGTLNIENPPDYNTINILAWADPPTTVTLGTFTNPTDPVQWASVTGLAPAAINYELADTSSVYVRAPHFLHTGVAPGTIKMTFDNTFQ